MAKISEIIIGMILFTVIISGIILFSTSLSQEYSSLEFNDTNSSLYRYNKSSAELLELADEIRNDTITSTDESNDLQDVLGAFFKRGYNVLRFSTKSYDTAMDLTNTAVSDAPSMGGFGAIVGTAALAILCIIIFFIVISTLVKREV